MISREPPEDFKHIFGDKETARLGAEGALGDALNSIGARIMSPDEVENMIEEADAFKQHFPFSLSLDGFSIPRPKSWVRTSIEDEEPASPSTAELVGALSENALRGVQLDQRSFANLDEVITVGEAFPRHDFYWDFGSRSVDSNFDSEYFDSASIIGLTVVRLLVHKENYNTAKDHPRIHQEALYPIREDTLWGYDFVRAAGSDALMLFEPNKRLAIPALNRTAFEELVRATYYTPSGEFNDFARNISTRSPEKILKGLRDHPRLATKEELFYVSTLIEEAVSKAGSEERDEIELAQLRDRWARMLFSNEDQS